MTNEYGQLAHKSSIGQAVDALLEAYTLEAFGVYASPADDEPPVQMEQGGKKKGQRQQEPQHQLKTDGIIIVSPAVYAEKQAFERNLWRMLRREHARLLDLGEGMCLRCRERNDQPRRRYCSKCEAKVA